MFLREETIRSIDDPAREREGDMIGEGSAVALVPTDVETPINTHGLNLSRVETKLDLIKEAARTLPTNEFNLPTYIYRTDLLSVEVIQKPENLEPMLEAARIYLEYHHGFPTLGGEQPFWSKLPWETDSQFAAFLFYLELEGARNLQKIQSVAPDLLSQYYHSYYWAQRALAYDMYRAAHHERLRHQRIFEVEDTHWKAAKGLFNRLSTALDGVDLKDVEPDKLVKMMSTAAQIQRAAAGLSPTGAVKGDDKGPKSPSVEISMRQIAENQGAKPTHVDELDFSQIYNDPEALKAAQSLVIKVNR
jgi:hypothetical protein